MKKFGLGRKSSKVTDHQAQAATPANAPASAIMNPPSPLNAPPGFAQPQQIHDEDDSSSEEEGFDKFSAKERQFMNMVNVGPRAKVAQNVTSRHKTLPSQQVGVSQEIVVTPLEVTPSYPAPGQPASENNSNDDYSDDHNDDARSEANKLSTKDEGEWKATKSPTGRTYYFHTVTRATRWDVPPELAAAQSAGGGADGEDDAASASALRQELHSVKAKLVELEAQREQDQAQAAALRSEREQLVATNQGWEEKLRLREQQMNAELENARAEASQARSDAAVAKAEAAAARDVATSAQAQSDSESGNLQATLRAKESEIATLKQQIQQLQAGTNSSDKQQLAALIEQQSVLKENEELLRSNVQAKEYEIEQLRQAIGREHERANSAEQQLSQVSGISFEHQSTIRNLQSQLQAEVQHKQHLEARLQTLSSEAQGVAGMQIQIQTLTDKLRAAQEAETTNREQWGNLEQAMRQNLESVQQSARQAASERNAAQMQVQELQRQLQSGAGGGQSPSQQQHSPSQSSPSTARPVQQPLAPLGGNRLQGPPPPQVQNSGGQQYGQPNTHSQGFSSTPPPPPKRLSPEEGFAMLPYFHGKIGGGQAEALLRGRPVATFLFRFSSQAGHLAVSYVWTDQIVHALIAYNEETVWKVDEPNDKYPDLPGLVAATQHVMAYPVHRQN